MVMLGLTIPYIANAIAKNLIDSSAPLLAANLF